MQQLKLRDGVIEQIKRDRNLSTDYQVAAVLGVTADDVDAMRHGAPISRRMALQVAEVQGSDFDLSRWVEYMPSTRIAG